MDNVDNWEDGTTGAKALGRKCFQDLRRKEASRDGGALRYDLQASVII